MGEICGNKQCEYYIQNQHWCRSYDYYKNVAQKLLSYKLPFIKSNVKLQMYDKNSLTTLGKINVMINNNYILDFRMLVIKEEDPSLHRKTRLKA